MDPNETTAQRMLREGRAAHPENTGKTFYDTHDERASLRIAGPGDRPKPGALNCQVILDDLTQVRNSVIECQAEAEELDDDTHGASVRAGLSQLAVHVDVVIGLVQQVMRL